MSFLWEEINEKNDDLGEKIICIGFGDNFKFFFLPIGLYYERAQLEDPLGGEGIGGAILVEAPRKSMGIVMAVMK